MLNSYWLPTGFSSCYCRKCLFKGKKSPIYSFVRAEIFLTSRVWHSFATSVQDWLCCCPGKSCKHICPQACQQALVTWEAHFQLPLSAAQLTGARNQPSLQTPAWAGVQCWTPQQRNPVVDKTRRHYWAVQAEEIIFVSVMGHLFLSLPFNQGRNEISIKPPSFMLKCSSCAVTFFKIQDLVLPAANWQPWLALCRIRHIQMEHIFKDHLSK